MITGKRINSHVTTTLAVIGAVAVAMAFAIGFQGWPPASANAADMDSALTFGLEDSQVVVLADEVTATDKFEASIAETESAEGTASADSSASAEGTLAAGESSATAALVISTNTIEPILKIFKPAPKPKAKAKPKPKHYHFHLWRAARVSWYGPGFYGHGMAGGGRLRRDSMIVAHRYMKFGTRLRIYYKGRVCTAVVKDRGPFVRGRTFDLGPGVAKSLKFSGVGTIRYQVVSR